MLFQKRQVILFLYVSAPIDESLIKLQSSCWQILSLWNGKQVGTRILLKIRSIRAIDL